VETQTLMPEAAAKSIIDAFTFFNEAEICELRMRVLDPVVDTFVVVEASQRAFFW
jgi:hypothetical protein